MRLRFAALFILLLVGCSSSRKSSPPTKSSIPIDQSTVGVIHGTITFNGNAPKPQPIDMSQDPACAMAGVPPNFGEAYAVNQGHLQNVYVYVKDGLGDYSYPVSPPVVLDQRGCRYIPHVVGVMAGQTLRVLNSDPTMHNVHTSSQANMAWNISQMPNSGVLDEKFTLTELMVPVDCNQHPWMKMYLNVSSHPFFAVTDKDGNFEIKGLPPGDYTIAAVHEKLGEKTARLTVRSKQSSTVDFTFSALDTR